MSREPIAQTMDDLRAAVDIAWQRFSQATINGLINRMLCWIESCRDVRGQKVMHPTIFNNVLDRLEMRNMP
ncbi:hypothetical protein TNCV_2227511 [Trichonephila clavipes]|uniref:Uncharacterized protein n=1 Tax=Trichonephila clavipes TaxID=2585209 RepID=A0A8X7BKA4_TRICX|nr:hypothetical protein TNCV_2227511 [Trichonephila clavipes]